MMNNPLREAHDEHLAKYLAGSMTEDEFFNASLDAVIAALPETGRAMVPDQFTQGVYTAVDSIKDFLQQAKTKESE